MLAEGGDANISTGGHVPVSVVKRDGSSVPFNSDKIRSAVSRAFLSVGETADDAVLDGIVSRVLDRLGSPSPHVETVQDAVERSLMETSHYSVAKSYILYRERHRGLRDESAFLLDIDGTMGGYLSQSDWRVHENSNVNFSLGGLILHNSGAVTANYWLNSVYSPEVAAAHRDCSFHIHDLSMLAPYCCGHSLRQLIKEGLGGVPDKLSSSPARHLSTICQQMVNFLGIMQNEWAGAQAFSSFDTYLAPFVKADSLSDREVKQGLQSFIYGVNTPSRWGSQAPFTNITLDWVCPDDLRDKPAVVGGEEQDFTYGDCQAEMDTINRIFIELMVEGDAVGRGFQYPIPTYNITKDFDWDSPNAALLFGMAGKYGTPYFQNFINSDLNPNSVRSMCPLAHDTGVLVKTSRGVGVCKIGELFDIHESRGIAFQVWDGFKWCGARANRSEDQRVLSVRLSNNSSVLMGEFHRQPVVRDGVFMVVSANELRAGDRIPYNKSVVASSDLGSYEYGFAVGAYAGDGSHDGDSAVYSLDSFGRKDDVREKVVGFLGGQLGFSHSVCDSGTGAYSLRFSQGSYGLVSGFVKGDSAAEKRLSRRVFGMSESWRRGFLDGFAATDGSRDKRRVYTSSRALAEQAVQLFNSLGERAYLCSVDEGEGRLSDRPVYCVAYPQRERYGDTYDSDSQYNYWFVQEVSEVEGRSLFCLEVDNDDHVFMLADGMITGNCRLQLDLRELRRRGGGLFGSDEFTGSVGVVTINLPQLGYLSKDEGEEGFFRRLDRLMELAKQSLETKRKVVTRLMERGLYPYTRRYLAHFDNHFSTIGVCGMNECCLNFLNADITSERGRAFAVKVLDYMRQRMQDFQEETGNLYNLEATPAESTSYRLAKHDRERYPDIIAGGTEDSPFYTNSTQLPVMYTDDVFEALDLQDPLQTRYTGGTVFHIMLGESVKDWKAVRELVRTVASSYRLPYFSVSPTFSVCPVHGYIDGEHFDCPKCAAERRARLQEKLRALYDERDKLAGEG